MPTRRILDSISFRALDADEQQNAVRNLFNVTYQNEEALKPTSLQLFMQPDPALGRNRKAPSLAERRSFTTTLDFYGSQLAQTNVVSFQYLNDLQKKTLEERLLFTFYFLSAQYLLDQVEDRRQVLEGRAKQIIRCANLIKELRAHPKTLETSLQGAIDESDKCLKYLGITLAARTLAKGMEAVATGDKKKVDAWAGAGKTGFIKGMMDDVNGVRLYWVWAGGFLNAVFSMLPEDFPNKTQGQKAVSAPSPVTGYMSWVLYYARLGIQLLLVFKHTVPGWWMRDDEKRIPPWERFTTQLDQRKFAILNDSIWATANLACFFWLKGSGVLGYVGNFVTAGLLFMDSCLTIWRFAEESTQHNVDLKRFELDEFELKRKIAVATAQRKTEEEQYLQDQLLALEKAKAHCAVEWKYKKYQLCKDLAYAIALMLAFIVVCGFLTPAGVFLPGVLLGFGVVGAGLCFLLTAFNSVAGSCIDIAKAQESKKLARLECEEFLAKFKSETDPNLKKILYLDMKQLMAESDYQARLVNFKQFKLVHTLFVDILVPPLIFVSFVFMPLGIGAAVLAAGILLAFLSHMLLKQFEPQKSDLPGWDDEEYRVFVELPKPTIEDLKPTAKPHQPSFFAERVNGLTSESGVSLDAVLPTTASTSA